MKKVAVVGATGYTGQELIRLLMQHEQVELKSLVSHSQSGKAIRAIYPTFAGLTDLICSDESLDELSQNVDVIFIALPHAIAAERVTANVLDRCKVIDLGADFRLKQAHEYETWYGFKHPQPELLSKAVYGLPELNRELIRSANLIANPGCFATCAILSLAPLLGNALISTDSIVIDGKSGASGAGRGVTLGMHFNEVNESIKAYKVAEHRHTPEIEQALSEVTGHPLKVIFTPHLVPMNRGILTTSYAKLLKQATSDELLALYQEFYKSQFFIRGFDGTADYAHPETRFVKGSNFFDFSITVDARTQSVIALGAIDNLIKGAAGQAIQNMNIALGLPENCGLTQASIFPA